MQSQVGVLEPGDELFSDPETLDWYETSDGPMFGQPPLLVPDHRQEHLPDVAARTSPLGTWTRFCRRRSPTRPLWCR